jgi:hypothetical protein
MNAWACRKLCVFLLSSISLSRVCAYTFCLQKAKVGTRLQTTFPTGHNLWDCRAPWLWIKEGVRH